MEVVTLGVTDTIVVFATASLGVFFRLLGAASPPKIYARRFTIFKVIGLVMLAISVAVAALR